MAEPPEVYCAEQVRRFDRERYLCALLAREPAREHLLALYAFNVEVARVREIVSEPVIGQMRLQWWRDAVAEFAKGTVRAHPVSQALARALAWRPVRPELIERLLVGREFDLTDEPPTTLDALESYAEETSSVLLQAALDLLGAGGGEADEAARHIGIAWALVGLLRAVPFHARQRRLYLPRDLLDAAAVTPEHIFEGRTRAELREVAAEITARARAHLEAARRLNRAVPREALPALLPAILVDRHMARLSRERFDLFSPRLRRPTPADAARLAFARFRGRY